MGGEEQYTHKSIRWVNVIIVQMIRWTIVLGQKLKRLDGGRLSKMGWEGHQSWLMVVDCPRWARIVKDYGRWW